MQKYQYHDVNTTSKFVEDGIQVVKTNKIYEFDENTYTRIEGSSFHNGEIKVKVKSNLLKDAPDFARGFIGIAFRIHDDAEFECFYVRPTNGRCEDEVRKRRACQYFSYPTYTFDYFRENGISDYENGADIGLDEWIDLKIIVEDEKASLYVNGVCTLNVEKMFHGVNSHGSVGLFVDIGTEGVYKDLEIICKD